jgi:hypothetical protein
VATRPERRPKGQDRRGRHDAALSSPFGIGRKAANRGHRIRRTLYLISQPRFLHFTLNHYTTAEVDHSLGNSRIPWAKGIRWAKPGAFHLANRQTCSSVLSQKFVHKLP